MNTLTSHVSSVVALSLCCLFLNSGCVRYHRDATETELGTHHVSISPPCRQTSTRSQSHVETDGSSRILFYELTCGDFTVSVRDSMLSVNGKSYGALNEGDKIAIDFGKVRVNSEVRTEVR